MINEINDGTISVLMRCSLPVANPEEVRQAPAQQRAPQRRYVESKQDLSEPSETQRGMQQAASGDTRSRQQVVQTIRNEGPKIGRNDPCPCGSGKKFKNCHGQGL